MILKLQQGMMLLTLWIILGLLFLSVVMQMTMVLLQQKMVNNLWKQQQIRRSLESVAYYWMNKPNAQWPARCVVPAFLNPNRAIKNLHVACAVWFQQQKYRIFFEDIGCMNNITGGHHWRLTTGIVKNHIWKYLQIRFIFADKLGLCNNTHVIHSGMISWRLG